jgi:large subunit ribosomal protein L15
MNLHSLKNNPGAHKSRKRVGRGEASGTGKTSGRGHKGQGSRSGSGYKPTFEGGQMPLFRRLPKYGFKNINRKEYLPLNVSALEQFEDGSEVTPEVLREAGLVKGRIPYVKILGAGELGRKLTVSAHAFSKTARAKIEAAGGTAKLVS